MKRPTMKCAYTVSPCANGFLVSPRYGPGLENSLDQSFVCESTEALREIMLRLNRPEPEAIA